MSENNKDLPLISIITPCYNAEKFIGKTIDSVLKQSYFNYEMIVVENGSIDNSGMVIREYERRDNRIKQLKIKVNKGGANAWKVALDNSTGEYIAFLDADDLWDCNKLKKQIEFMIKNKYDFTYTKYHWIDENDNDLNNIVSVESQLAFEDFIGNTCIGCSTVMIKKSVINSIQIPTYQRKNWDFVTWGLILKNGYRAYGLNDDLMCYRILPNSTSRNKFEYAKIVWDVYSKSFKIPFFKRIKPFSRYAWNAIKRNFFYKKK